MMKHLKKSSLALLVILLVAGVLALTGCSATPLPPLFLAGGSGATQPAAPAALAPASEPAAVEAPAIATSEVVTITEAVAGAQSPAAAPAVSVTVTETSALNATGVITASVRAADVVSITAPITSSVVISPAEAVVAAATQPTSTPTATRVAPTATRVAPTATRVAPTATRVAPTATRVAPTATRIAPTATRVAPTATRAPARPSATPTPEWPKTLVITAEDIEQGASSVPGLQISGLDVTFGNDTMTMTFDSLRYSFVSMRNVTIEGHFVVSNGDVDFVADSISPRNLATGAIPGFINQSLDQQLSEWYVESVTVQSGQLVATVRPR